MLCRRAVGRIPHCLASITSFLFSVLSHRKPGACTDNTLVSDDWPTSLVLLLASFVSLFLLVFRQKFFWNKNKQPLKMYVIMLYQYSV